MSDPTHPRSDRPRLRLYTTDPLDQGASVAASDDQAHYLAHVMRAAVGESVLLFNGRDGEWLAEIATISKRGAAFAVTSQVRPQSPEPDVWLLTAPIKRDRIDLIAEKASELGASQVWPVFTRRTVMGRVNIDRLRAHLVEAAEQCERLSVPHMPEAQDLERVISQWPADRVLVFLDEGGAPPLPDVLKEIADQGASGKLAILVGPEGGFTPEEREWLRSLAFVRPAGLGPRILRAETAAIAALAITQAILF